MMKYLQYISKIILIAFTIYLIYRLLTLCITTDISESRISLISSIILTLVTTGYLIVTFIMMKIQKTSNRDTIEFMQRQSEISILPVFHCAIKNDSGNLSFIVSNIGKMPAYNVDIHISCSVTYDEIYQYTKEPLIKRPDDTEEDPYLYTIRDVIYYPLFMNGKKNTFRTSFPINPGLDCFTILIQYSNIYGDYFSNVFYLIDDTDGERKFFQIGAIEPERIEKHIYVNLHDPDFTSDIPQYLKDHLHEKEDILIYKYNMFDYLIEDRGEWTDI